VKASRGIALAWMSRQGGSRDSDQTVAFPTLSVLSINFLLEAVDPIRLPEFSGSSFRGLLGWALKEAACRRPSPCEQCCLPTECPYAYLFETVAADPTRGDDTARPLSSSRRWGCVWYPLGNVLRWVFTSWASNGASFVFPLLRGADGTNWTGRAALSVSIDPCYGAGTVSSVLQGSARRQGHVRP